jgi:hypothetical protein
VQLKVQFHTRDDIVQVTWTIALVLFFSEGTKISRCMEIWFLLKLCQDTRFSCTKIYPFLLIITEIILLLKFHRKEANGAKCKRIKE